MRERDAIDGGHWLPLLARIEWHSGSRGEERPVAVICGGERLSLKLLWERVEGPREAGGPLSRVLVMRDARGRMLRIRTGGGGETRVEVAVSSLAERE
ncbi:MAG: hypothetical protein V1750_04540 [Acidobacteriota bacterium]